ncbi:hypothetical protein HO173_012224 [Letharia columbiana]|uniref:Uncharacterized protein n=1 Tax=Letharia columbiana TaxID=112416 RepID=A0A8H6CQ82_9LECA|nr:uncharacterized protein HO173_012224 [Letharia columbiana]KAF6227484.1 hypothetical protein HO173_012224 [Letharia columbiana]
MRQLPETPISRTEPGNITTSSSLGSHTRPRRNSKQDIFADDLPVPRPDTETIVLEKLKLMSPDYTTFRTEGQRRALCAVQYETCDLEDRGPVSPSVALLERTMRKCQQRGISCIQFMRGVREAQTLVFVSVKLVSSDDFTEYVNVLTSRNLLSMVVFDEVYTRILDREYREAMEEVNILARLAPRRVALTASMPSYMETESRSELHMNSAAMIRESTTRANISYNVRRIEGSKPMEEAVEIMKGHLKSLQPGHKAIVFPRITEQCRWFATKLNANCYYNDLPGKQNQLEAWLMKTEPAIMVGSPGLGTELDENGIAVVFFYDAYFDASGFIL